MGTRAMGDPRAAWRVVEAFEAAIAEYCGAQHAIATDSCTNALHLCFKRLSGRARDRRPTGAIALPKRTYVGVAQAAINAGMKVEFINHQWIGDYQIRETKIVDAARWLRRGMHAHGRWTCLSFHFTKHLPIGRGGAILCDDAEDAEWFRRARYDGRDQTKPIMEQAEFQWGIHAYMPPEAAARGLLLMNNLKDHNDPLLGQYPDLSKVRFT